MALIPRRAQKKDQGSGVGDQSRAVPAAILASRSIDRLNLCISSSLGLCRFRNVEQLRQVAAAVNDSLDAHGSGDNAEEDNVAAHNGQPRSFANFGTKPIEERPLPDSEDLMPDLPDEGNCTLRIVFGDEIGNGFKIAFDKAGEFEAHPYGFPAASAMARYLRSSRSKTPRGETPGE